MNLIKEEEIFSTDWFKVISKHFDELKEPYYEIRQNDYVTIIAVMEKQLILVKQFRPILSALTLELPSGNVDDHELPEKAIKRELLEETDFQANTVELLSVIHPDTERMSNKLWCYFSDDVQKNPSAIIEKGLEPITIQVNEIKQYLIQGKINNALHLAALHLCNLNGKI